MHRTPEGETRVIEKPNEYDWLPLDEKRNLRRTAILKIHGAVDRVTPGTQKSRDSFVITEDHYIDYLTRADISSLIPVTLSEKLKNSNLLFLGYSLRDWNLRVILHRIWVEQAQYVDYKSWAVQLNPKEMDRQYWQKSNVTIFNISLDEYIEDLRQHTNALARSENE